MKRIACLVVGYTVMSVIGLCCIGCSSSYWLGTEDVSDSVSIYKGAFGAGAKVTSRKDTKGKIDLESVTWNATEQCFELKGLHADYDGRATDVITADGVRAMAVGQAQMSQAMYVREVAGFVTAVGGAVKSGLLGYGEARSMIMSAATSPLQQGGSFNLGPNGITGSVGGMATSQPSN